MRLLTIQNQSYVAKAWDEFDEAGRMKPSPYYDHIVDVMEELVRLFIGCLPILILVAVLPGSKQQPNRRFNRSLEGGEPSRPHRHMTGIDQTALYAPICKESFHMTLLHRSADGRVSPCPGQSHPTASVTGMPSAVKPFRTATRTWNSAT